MKFVYQLGAFALLLFFIACSNPTSTEVDNNEVNMEDTRGVENIENTDAADDFVGGGDTTEVKDEK